MRRWPAAGGGLPAPHPEARLGPHSEAGLTLLGLVVLETPLKPGIAATVHQLRELGERLKMIESIREGRCSFANTLKYVFMATSANVGNMLTDLPEMTIAGDRVDADGWIDRGVGTSPSSAAS